MGCISSKILCRSLSFQDELKQRSGKSIHVLQEIASAEHANLTWDSISTRDQTTQRRSTSWDSFPEILEISKETWNCNGRGRARSFHTVEEYDALIMQQQQTRKIESAKDCLGVEQENPESVSCPVVEIANQKGMKRKSIAKSLQSLEIPQAIEFPNAASLKACGQQAIMPGGPYVTPKFGSYYCTTSADECKKLDFQVFKPELVAAYEENMHQLEAEAETILNQIAENLES